MQHFVMSRRFKLLNSAIYVALVVALILACPEASLTGGTGTAAAAPTPSTTAGGLTVTATAGYDQKTKIGSYTPVKVEIENNGPAFNAEVVVDVRDPSSPTKSQFVQKIHLAENSRKRVVFYVPVYEMVRSIDVMVNGGREPVKAKAEVTTVGYNEVFVGVLSSDSSALTHLSALKFPQAPVVRVLPIEPGDIPNDAQMLSALDVIVVSNVDSTVLSTAQVSAIGGWVSQGGSLVLAGGPTWQKSLKPFSDLLPVVVSGTDQVRSLDSLTVKANKPFGSSGPFSVSVSKPKPGVNVLVSESGNPIIATQKTGQGNVTYWALDLSLDPLVSWAGNSSIWQAEIQRMVPWVGGGVPREAYASTAVRRMNGQIQWALRNLPNFVVPGTRSLVIALLGYVLLIGPVNFWVLRRIKRSELAWVTIPVLVLVVTTLTYVVGFYSKGRDVFTNTISIVKVADTGAATASTYVGVFAPSKNSYRITFPGRANVTPVPMQFGGYYEEMQGSLPVGTRIVFGESTEVEFPSMNMWSMQAINLEEQVDLGGKITASVYPTATGLRGTITNNTRSAFKDCYVVTRDAYAKIPSLAPGQTAEVAIEIKYDLQNMHGPFLIDRIFDRGPQRYGVTEDLREQTRKRQIMSTMIGNPYEATDSVNSPVTFLGFTDAPLTKVLPRVNQGSENPYLALVAVPLQISISKGDVTYPPGLITTTLADQGSGMRGKFGPGFYFVDRGDLTFVMNIPAGVKQISAMSLYVMAQPRGGTGTSIEGYLYNWQTNRWDRFDAAPGENSVATPSVYVSPTGVVQYRVSATTNPFEMRDPTLSFTGRVE